MTSQFLLGLSDVVRRKPSKNVASRDFRHAQTLTTEITEKHGGQRS
jgi:hypothetical protein